MSNITINPQIEESWKKELSTEFAKPYFKELKTFLLEEKAKYKILPPGKEMFKAFNLTPFDKVKVVIIGQDPYPGIGQAEGLCFSVKQGVMIPRSLQNIYKELHTDIGFIPPAHGSLVKWASQGVLLLNAVLSVRAGQTNSHQGHGWENFTSSVIEILNAKKSNLVFILWGAFAQKKAEMLDASKHYILKSPHPSPLSASRGFFGCKHFSKTNEFLLQTGQSPIDWQL